MPGIVFDWLRRKRRGAPPASGDVHVEGQETLDPVKAAELAAHAGERKPIPLGRWVWMELPWELKDRFLGYVYLDPTAGLSAKGGPESAAQIAELPTYTVRLSLQLPI